MPSRSVMLYGSSGSTKTSQCYLLAKWLLAKPENKGKRFRMIYADGGGFTPFVDSGMVERKEVEVFDFSYRQHALADYRKLAEGYWPLYNVKTKTETYPEYFKKDENCRTKDWGNILGYIVEGMSSCAEALKNHISNQREGVGFKESWSYEEDGETLTGLQQGHYGLIQKEMYNTHMRGFKTLPVEWLVYTSLLGKGEDKQSRETVYGPQVAGSAMTAQTPSLFMDCIHLDRHSWQIQTKEGEVKQKEGMVAWFTQHLDASTQVPYLAKARVMPESFPELMKYYPGGFVPLDYVNGISQYFRVLEKLRKEQMNAGTTTG